MGMFPRVSDKEALILGLISGSPRGEMYGLEMVRASGGLLKRGTVYVTLSRMASRGLVSSFVDEKPPPPGPPRRVYRLTPLAKRLMAAAEAIGVAS